MGTVPDTREQIIEAGYACIARYGVARTSVEDVAQAAGVSRATMYRYFASRSDLVDAVVTWEYRRFFLRLYEAVSGAETLEEVMERGLMVARRSLDEHEVLQMVLVTEPEVLEPAMSAESAPTLAYVSEFLIPYLERHELRPGVDVEEAADFLGRMLLSYMGAPGRWDLEDPDQVSQLVRAELLSGIVPEPARQR